MKTSGSDEYTTDFNDDILLCRDVILILLLPIFLFITWKSCGNEWLLQWKLYHVANIVVQKPFMSHIRTTKRQSFITYLSRRKKLAKFIIMAQQALRTVKEVKPILSLNKDEARKRVLNLYKAWYRQLPYVGKSITGFTVYVTSL